MTPFNKQTTKKLWPFRNLYARHDKSFKKPFALSCSFTILHLSTNKQGLGEEKKFTPGASQGGGGVGGRRELGVFWGCSPQTPPTELRVHLEALRSLPLGGSRGSCPALPFQEAAVAFQGGSDLSSHHSWSRVAVGAASRVLFRGVANLEPPDN